MDRYDILIPLQHGFCKSCETQLLVTVDNLMRSFDHKVQSDVAILDFWRAFDTVLHECLLITTEYVGI